MLERLKRITSGCCDINVSRCEQKNNHRIVREFNKGRSLSISVWAPNIAYSNDDFNQDLVTFDNVILACTKSHLSSSRPELIYDEDKPFMVIGVNSEYWELVLTNHTLIYAPEVNDDGVVEWTLSNKLPTKYIPALVFVNGAGEYSAVLTGSKSIASGTYAVAEGGDNIFGKQNPAPGDKLEYSTASGYASHAEGAAHAIGNYSHAEGGGNTDLTAEGFKTVSTAEGECSHAEGTHTWAKAGSSHAEGNRTLANGVSSHAEGRETISEGLASHAEGFNTKTGGTTETNSRSAGTDTRSGAYAHAEGNATIAKGVGAHSEGTKTIAIGTSSHAEGHSTSAVGFRSHAEGKNTIANGRSSHSEGEYTITNNVGEHAEGCYNKSNSTTIHSVGIGTSSTRKNAHEISTTGKHYIYNLAGYNGTNPSDTNDLVSYITALESRIISLEAILEEVLIIKK